MKRTKHSARSSTVVDKHYVGGSGGSRAFLAGAGSLLACHVSGYANWRSIGGVSGGSIATLLYAGGVPAGRIVEAAVDLDFTTLVSQKSSITHFVRTKVRRKCNREPLAEGFVSTEGLGVFLEGLVSEWPANYWTLAVAGSSQILFTAEGVFEYKSDGRRVLLSSEPAPVGLAVRASCAVPGVLEAVRLHGRDLFDGAISRDGGCPVQLVKRHYGVSTDDIVACELDGRVSKHHSFDRIGEFYARFVSQSFRQRARRPEGITAGSAAGVYVRPVIDGFTSLQFSLTREQKQEAVLEAFSSTVRSLTLQGLVSPERLSKVQAACQSYADLQRLFLTPEPQVVSHHKWWQFWRHSSQSETTPEARPSWT